MFSSGKSLKYVAVNIWGPKHDRLKREYTHILNAGNVCLREWVHATYDHIWAAAAAHVIYMNITWFGHADAAANMQSGRDDHADHVVTRSMTRDPRSFLAHKSFYFTVSRASCSTKISFRTIVAYEIALHISETRFPFFETIPKRLSWLTLKASEVSFVTGTKTTIKYSGKQTYRTVRAPAEAEPTEWKGSPNIASARCWRLFTRPRTWLL